MLSTVIGDSFLHPELCRLLFIRCVPVGQRIVIGSDRIIRDHLGDHIIIRAALILILILGKGSCRKAWEGYFGVDISYRLRVSRRSRKRHAVLIHCRQREPEHIIGQILA